MSGEKLKLQAIKDSYVPEIFICTRSRLEANHWCICSRSKVHAWNRLYRLCVSLYLRQTGVKWHRRLNYFQVFDSSIRSIDPSSFFSVITIFFHCAFTKPDCGLSSYCFSFHAGASTMENFLHCMAIFGPSWINRSRRILTLIREKIFMHRNLVFMYFR